MFIEGTARGRAGLNERPNTGSRKRGGHETSPQMDCRAMARVAWSRDGRLASWTGLGRDLVDRKCAVLEEVI
jgi:hypothetical protein